MLPCAGNNRIENKRARIEIVSAAEKKLFE